MRIMILIGFMVFLTQVSAQEECDPIRTKKQEKELAECKSLSRSNPRAAIECFMDIKEEPALTAEALWESGSLAYEMGSLNRAQSDLEELTELCPIYNIEAWYYLGMTYYNQQDYSSAAEAFQTYLDEGPGYPEREEEAIKSQQRASLIGKLLENPVPFDPKPVRDLSTDLDEYLPAFSPDNSIMLFTRGTIKIDKKPYGSERVRVEQLTISEMIEGVFTEGNALPKPFNKGLNEGGASIAIDNNEIFITICNSEDGYGSCDLYSTIHDGFVWGDLINLGPTINDSMWQSQVSVAADKNTLFFTSDREGGFGGKDIWIGRRDSTGAWTILENAGPTINSEYDEQSPFIHPDDNTLYYSTNNPALAMGGYDIAIIRKLQDGSWATPENIGYPINSEKDDIGFFVSTNGKEAFFASNKLKGEGGYDVYGFPLYEDARPIKLLFVKGQILDENGQVLSNVSIELKDLVTNEITEIEIDESTGKYIINEHFENDQLMTVNRDGFFYGAKVISKEDEEFEAPGQIDFKLRQLMVGQSFEIENILFDTDSYVIAESSKLELLGLVRFMEVNPLVSIEVAGHTDNVGSPTDNLALSDNRSKAVRQFLIENGIDASRLKAKGYGEKVPIASNDTEQGRALNRRTEVEILDF